MPGLKGALDVAAAERLMSDHVDAFEDKSDAPSERTLCSHVDLSPHGMKPWQDEFGPAGVVQAKVTGAALATRMSMEAAIGHPCGLDFRAAEHLTRYPQFAWQKTLFRGVLSRP